MKRRDLLAFGAAALAAPAGSRRAASAPPGYRVTWFDAKAAGADLMTTAQTVAGVLHRFDNALDPQRLAEQASSKAASAETASRSEAAGMNGARLGPVPSHP
mgnify:CR=1 FL=1